MTLKDRIRAELRASGPLMDAALARRLGVQHQSVNQAARQLAAAGVISRERLEAGLVNRLTEDGGTGKVIPPPRRVTTLTAPKWSAPPLPPPGTIGLVGCVSAKASDPAPASELYRSPLFNREKEWATARCSTWYVLSAKHHVLERDRVVEPYDDTLDHAPVARKRAWSRTALAQLQDLIPNLRAQHFEIYAGRDYYAHGLLSGLEEAGASVALPWADLGIGQRLQRKEYELTDDAAAVVERLAHPDRLWSRAECLSKPSPVPAAAGLYAWYLRGIPVVQSETCVRRDDLALMYVGIAPKGGPSNGKASSANLRSRIRTHYGGNAESSTLRLTLASLLTDQLGLAREIRTTGRSLGAGEAVLSAWMNDNAFVTWIEHPQPWTVEPSVIASIDLPLNLAHNRSHPFHPELSRLRSRLVRSGSE